MQDEQFSTYLFIAKEDLFQLITPFNFAYGNLYTFNELVLLPLILMVRLSSNFVPLSKAYHSIMYNMPYKNINLFEIQQMENLNKQQACFLSIPSNISRNNLT